MATTNIAYFEFKSGGSDKFYLMEQDPNGTSFTARYGRCGTTGSVATYPMSKAAGLNILPIFPKMENAG